jgi:hypothetical protein
LKSSQSKKRETKSKSKDLGKEIKSKAKSKTINTCDSSKTKGSKSRK